MWLRCGFDWGSLGAGWGAGRRVWRGGSWLQAVVGIYKVRCVGGMGGEQNAVFLSPLPLSGQELRWCSRLGALVLPLQRSAYLNILTGGWTDAPDEAPRLVDSRCIGGSGWRQGSAAWPSCTGVTGAQRRPVHRLNHRTDQARICDRQLNTCSHYHY